MKLKFSVPLWLIPARWRAKLVTPDLERRAQVWGRAGRTWRHGALELRVQVEVPKDKKE